MTQYHFRILSIISISCLSLTIFSLPTLICLCFSVYFVYRYLKMIVNQYAAKGLIELCPDTVRRQLLNRSIFDFICGLWFDTSFIFLKKFCKLLFKPLVEPIERQNALQALNDMDQQTRKIYLTKGVIRVLPQVCQAAFLGRERADDEKKKYFQASELRIDVIKRGNSERNTEDKSQSNEPKRLIRVNSESRINNCSRMLEDQWSGRGSQKDLPSLKIKTAEVRIHKLKRGKPQGLIQTIHNSLNMLKKIVEMQNIGGNIQKMKSISIIKLMVIFWVALLVQIKFIKSARRTVIKTLYVLGGIVTVLGVVGTTGMLVYKHCKKRRNSELEGDS